MKLFKYIVGTVIGINLLVIVVVERLSTPAGLNLFWVFMGLFGMAMSAQCISGIVDQLKDRRDRL